MCGSVSLRRDTYTLLALRRRALAHQVENVRTPSTSPIVPSSSTRNRKPRQTERGERRRKFLVLGPFAFLLTFWMCLFVNQGAFKGGPGGKAFGADWAMFIGAASVIHHGGNPYDHRLLFVQERAMLRHEGLPITKRADVVRVGNPPLFLWGLQPLLRINFQSEAYAAILAMILCNLFGFLAILKYFEWTRRALACLMFLAMPQAIFGPFYANPICFVFLGLGLALALLKRTPYCAGALLAIAWLKPPVALPVVLLIWAFHAPRPRALATGFGLATLALFYLTLITSGASSLSQWVVGLESYSKDMAIQPDVASLAGLYVAWAPAPVRALVGGLLLATALALTFAMWRHKRSRGPVSVMSVAWIWIMWFLATPYAHFADETLLVIPIIALLGQNGVNVRRRYAAITLYAALFSLMVLQITPFEVYLLPVGLVIIGICLFRARHRPEYCTLSLAARPPGPRGAVAAT